MKAATTGNMERIAGELDAVTQYYEHHPDVGCKAAVEYYGYQGKCISCPIPVCLEESRTKMHLRMELRTEKARELMEKGMSIAEIADRLGVCNGTIYRGFDNGR